MTTTTDTSENIISPLDRSRRLARRRMGWIAFGLLVMESLTLFAGIFFAGPLFVANLTAASPLLTAMIWAQVALIGTYLGVSLTEALKKPGR